MRCPSCNKFPSLEIQEPEDYSIEIDNGVITGTVRLVLNTACCGDEAKETTFDVDHDITDQITEAFAAQGYKDVDLDTVEYGEVDTVATADDRFENKTPTGKPIRNPRYQKHYYRVTLEFRVQATIKGDDGKVVDVNINSTWTDEVQASSMEEL